MIYAIRAEAGGPIKFGFSSRRSRHRLSQLQVAHYKELEILAEVEGDKCMEALIHQHLSKHRIRGEWFRPTVPVLEMVRLMREGGRRALQRIALQIVEDYRACQRRSALINILSVGNALKRLNSRAGRYAQAS